MQVPGRQRFVPLYIAVLAILGLAVLHAYSLASDPPDPLILLFASIGMTLAGLNPLPTADRSVRFNFAGAVRMFALLSGGLPTAIWSSALSTVSVNLIQELPFRAVVLNTAQAVLSAFVAGELFYALGGQSGAVFAHLLPAVVAGIAQVLVNVSVMVVLFALIGKPVKQTMIHMTADVWQQQYIMAILLGIVAAFAHVKGGWAWSLNVWVAVVLLHGTALSLHRVFTEADRQRSRLDAALNATHSAIVMADDQGMIQVANARYAELIGAEAAFLLGRSLTAMEGSYLRQTLGGLRSGSTGTVEQVIHLPGQPARYLHWYRGQVAAGKAQGGGTIEVLTDVTAEREAHHKLGQMYLSMVLTLTAAIDARDAYTHGHSARVSSYAVVISRELGLPQEDQDRIRYAGLLHDIGKIGIDDTVLQKHGPLSPAEREMMMAHPVIGAKILEQSGAFSDLIPGVRWHHEWLNGQGYPDGLQGDDLPLDARILCVADSFDAMTSDRPYRKALTPEEALHRLETGRGTQFDPSAVNALQAVIKRGDLKVEMHTVPTDRNQFVGAVDQLPAVYSRELAIIYQVARELHVRRGVAGAARRFLEISFDTVGQYAYALYLRSEPGGQLALEAAVGGSRDLTGDQLPTIPRLAHAADHAGRAVLAAAEPHEAGYLFAETRSALAVPLLWDGRATGVLYVEADRPSAFTDSEVSLFEALSQQMANAVELARYHERLAAAAVVDALTGAYNHSALYQRLEDAVTVARAEGFPVSVVAVDVVGLGEINRQYGQQAGDAVLRAFVQRLRRLTRETGMVARYAGDRFAVVLPGVSKAEAARLVDELSSMPAEQVSAGGVSFPLPQAVGGSATFPDDSDRPTDVMALADRQVTRGKRLK